MDSKLTKYLNEAPGDRLQAIEKAIIEEIDTLAIDIEDAMQRFEKVVNNRLLSDLTTSNKEALRDYIDDLIPFDLQRFIKETIW